jgi:hypothetical protein
MQVAAVLAHKWVYDYAPNQFGVCRSPDPDVIEIDGFAEPVQLVVHGFQTQATAATRKWFEEALSDANKVNIALASELPLVAGEDGEASPPRRASYLSVGLKYLWGGSAAETNGLEKCDETDTEKCTTPDETVPQVVIAPDDFDIATLRSTMQCPVAALPADPVDPPNLSTSDFSMQWGIATCEATKTLYARARRFLSSHVQRPCLLATSVPLQGTLSIETHNVYSRVFWWYFASCLLMSNAAYR